MALNSSAKQGFPSRDEDFTFFMKNEYCQTHPNSFNSEKLSLLIICWIAIGQLTKLASAINNSRELRT